MCYEEWCLMEDGDEDDEDGGDGVHNVQDGLASDYSLLQLC